MDNSKRINTVQIGPFDIYNSTEDKIALKDQLKLFFSIDDEIFCFFSREEDLTSDEELNVLRSTIFSHIEQNGELKYLRKLDQRRFDAIARIKLDANFAGLIIDMMKYFFCFNFFKPINELTFEEYEDYLITTGVEDINGIRSIENALADFICVKGWDADNLIISYNSAIEIEDKLIYF